MSSFPEFFRNATGHRPYRWQERLACGNDPGLLPDHEANECVSRLIDIPTGLGKTAGVILAWLWNRVALKSARWPRRLVYCLPMRTLVEQTADEARGWIAALAKARQMGNEAPQVHVLMGGEDAGDWDLYPERDAILIGTQDMLLSRALNRGYGLSRYRWPMHFALLNNDCLWVLDEVQLMGPGLACTTQLEGFRKQTALGSCGCHSWWMSATIRRDWLKTVDLPSAVLANPPLCLLDEEKEQGRVKALRHAPKLLHSAGIVPAEKSAKNIAQFIAANRTSKGLNLAVVNTVKRARALHAELRKALPNGSAPPILLHSQFRPKDREQVLAKIRAAPPGEVVVSTQVIEAGMDLSVHTLFTELAPWSSLVQRFGRCNRWLDRNGQPHFADARIYWIDLDEAKDALPYRDEQLREARERLSGLANASISTLEGVASPDVDRPQFRHVIRRKDLVELFDSTPDLAGADLDIDRFIRDADDSHVQVFWREWPLNLRDKSAMPTGPAARREELCATGVGDLKALLGKQGHAYRWSYLDRQWEQVKADRIYPGQVYLLHADNGGYTPELGWAGDSKLRVEPLPPKSEREIAREEANETDPDSELSQWQTVAEHTDQVCREMEAVLRSVEDFLKEISSRTSVPLVETLRHSARWHDWGKAHRAFQAKLRPEMLASAARPGPIAKAPETAWKKNTPTQGKDERRRHFRHELASALGVLQPSAGFPLKEAFARDLAAYLIAAHHGKVRLSIRSLPDEWTPAERGRRFARGVWDDDRLPGVELGGGVTAHDVTLSLEPMELGLGEEEPFVGQPSWLERSLNLRDHFGPFALAYLETLLRVADARGSLVVPSHP